MSQAGQGVGTMTLGAIGTMPGFGDLAKMGLMGIFAGRGAKTADVLALSKAEKMAKKGISRDEIWKDTGWFQGADGKWRFEIDDSGARPVTWTETTPKGYSYEVNKLSHPELKKAYPEVYGDVRQNYTVNPDLNDFETGGRYSPKEKFIEATAKSHDDARSTILHEYDHAIQDAEGFAGGGSPSEFSSGKLNNYQKKLLDDMERVKFYKSIKKKGQDADVAFELVYGTRPDQRIKDLSEKLGDRFITNEIQKFTLTPYSRYHHLAGEVSARNVQARKDLTAAQRRAIPPWKTQDIPDDEQIIRGLLGNE